MRSSSMASGVALSLSILATGAPVLAQDPQATGSPPPAPAAGALEVAPGVTAEALAFVEGEEVPAVYRLRLDPGTTYDFSGDPSIALAVIESGSVGLTADTPLTVLRGDGAGAAGEPAAPSSAVDLAVGDHLILPALASGQLRNDGSEPAAILVASLASPNGGPDPSPGASPDVAGQSG